MRIYVVELAKEKASIYELTVNAWNDKQLIPSCSILLENQLLMRAGNGRIEDVGSLGVEN